jgi:hypothetical protein
VTRVGTEIEVVDLTPPRRSRTLTHPTIPVVNTSMTELVYSADEPTAEHDLGAIAREYENRARFERMAREYEARHAMTISDGVDATTARCARTVRR